MPGIHDLTLMHEKRDGRDKPGRDAVVVLVWREVVPQPCGWASGPVGPVLRRPRSAMN